MYDEIKDSEKHYLIALGKRIKALRLEKKISQTEVAYRCGFDKSNYNTIDSGKRNVTISSLLKISKALDIDFKDLFSF